MRDDGGGVVGDTEVRPVEVLVGPRWLPFEIQIEAVVWSMATSARVENVVRHSGDCTAVREENSIVVQVHFKGLVCVIALETTDWLEIDHPVCLTFLAKTNRASSSHGFSIVRRLAVENRQRPKSGISRASAGIIWDEGDQRYTAVTSGRFTDLATIELPTKSPWSG